MKIISIQLILLLTLLGGASAQSSSATNSPQTTSKGISTNASAPIKLSYIVTLGREADQDSCARDFSVQRRHTYRRALNGFSANLDAATVEKLRHDPRVRSVEPDGRVVLCSQTHSTGFVRMGVANFPEAHINGQDNRINVAVAVLDTGIQTNHPDLNVVQWVDCTGSGLNGDDWEGHGTHVAGIIGALDNDIGVVGVAPGVRLWSVQVIGTNGIGAWSDVIAGCDYIGTHADQIAVVNCSLGSDGSPTPYESIHQAVTNLVNLGIVFVAAAGNSSTDIFVDRSSSYQNNPNDIVPAAFAEVMTVSAMDPTNNYIAFFGDYSNWPHIPSLVNSPGAGIDLTEPGVDILSTYTNSGYATLSGTSMSCGFASGLVALYIAANGRATNAQGVYAIRQALIDSGQAQTNWPPNYFVNGIGYSDTVDPDGNKEPLGIPSESWVPLPTITNAAMTAQGFQMSFPTVPGYTYTVQQTDSLNPSNVWNNLTSTNSAGSLTTVTVTDPTPGITGFYRVMREPTP